MLIKYATLEDYDWLEQHDHHIHSQRLKKKIEDGEVLIASDFEAIGWLRFGYFWDNTPFMNMLYVRETYRQQSIGSQLVSFWEAEMLAVGYKLVLTSTQANETAQDFYRKLGYKDIGGFVLPNEEMELIFCKELIFK